MNDTAPRELVSHFDFSVALKALREWLVVTREWWNNSTISVHLQNPDEYSKMTESYLYMEKWNKRFPLDLSCESLLASDRKIVN